MVQCLRVRQAIGISGERPSEAILIAHRRASGYLPEHGAAVLAHAHERSVEGALDLGPQAGY